MYLGSRGEDRRTRVPKSERMPVNGLVRHLSDAFGVLSKQTDRVDDYGLCTKEGK